MKDIVKLVLVFLLICTKSGIDEQFRKISDEEIAWFNPTTSCEWIGSTKWWSQGTQCP